MLTRGAGIVLCWGSPEEVPKGRHSLAQRGSGGKLGSCGLRNPGRVTHRTQPHDSPHRSRLGNGGGRRGILPHIFPTATAPHEVLTTLTRPYFPLLPLAAFFVTFFLAIAPPFPSGWIPQRGNPSRELILQRKPILPQFVEPFLANLTTASRDDSHLTACLEGSILFVPVGGASKSG